MTEEEIFYQFKDSDGKIYTFTMAQYLQHTHHVELKIANFKDRIKRAVCEPEFIYVNYGFSNRYCYYYLEATISGRARYTKVVVEVKKNKRYSIITAFRPDNVKEAKYSKPIQSRP